MEIEKYSSLEVTDSDNNSIKESVEFFELFFQNESSESVGSHFGIQVAKFPLRNLSCKRRNLFCVAFLCFVKMGE